MISLTQQGVVKWFLLTNSLPIPSLGLSATLSIGWCCKSISWCQIPI